MPSKIVDVEWNPAKQMDMPLRKRKPGVIGLRDELFDQPDEFIDRVLAMAALCPQHQFVILTKQPERAVEYLGGMVGLESRGEEVSRQAAHMGGIIWDGRGSDAKNYGAVPSPPVGEALKKRRAWPGWPLTNVWMGVSVEDQKSADERMTHLMRIAALGWKTWVSYEPSGPVDWEPWLGGWWRCEHCGYFGSGESFRNVETPSGEVASVCPKCNMFCHDENEQSPIQCIVSGGESGPKGRPMRPDWPRQTRDACAEAGVLFFMKQMAKRAPIPDDLMIRELPWRAL